jgi:hypothetical protein
LLKIFPSFQRGAVPLKTSNGRMQMNGMTLKHVRPMMMYPFSGKLRPHVIR